jgi:hypothetical protein
MSKDISDLITKEGKKNLRKMLEYIQKSGILKNCYRVKHDKVDELFCQQIKNRKNGTLGNTK